jgi:hypothetical protein
MNVQVESHGETELKGKGKKRYLVDSAHGLSTFLGMFPWSLGDFARFVPDGEE